MKTLVATRVDIGPTVLRSDIRYNCMTVASDIDSQVRDVTAHLRQGKCLGVGSEISKRNRHQSKHQGQQATAPMYSFYCTFCFVGNITIMQRYAT